jgi:hypothetical protein
MIFKLYECDIGIKVNGVSYDFTHVGDITIEDPERTRLIRGSNAGNKEGLIYKEGLREPKILNVTIMEMTLEIKQVLDQVYEKQERVEVYAISRKDGSNKFAKSAVLAQFPQQLNLDDTPESMNVALSFETFDLGEIHKS